MHEPCKYLGIPPEQAGGDPESRTLLKCALDDRINGDVDLESIIRYYVQYVAQGIASEDSQQWVSSARISIPFCECAQRPRRNALPFLLMDPARVWESDYTMLYT